MVEATAGSARYLEGRVALITGGLSGMGRATALALASAGAKVAVGSLIDGHRSGYIFDGESTHLADEHALRAVKNEIETYNTAALAAPLDVASHSSVRDFVDATVKTFGKIDILVNAAGTNAAYRIVDQPEDVWARVFEVNVGGQYRTIKACMPGMMERKWGRIVNFSSTAGLVGHVRHAAYCASKAAVIGLSRCVALEGAEHGISCNAICPGWVITEASLRYLRDEMRFQGVTSVSIEGFAAAYAQKNIPMKRMMAPSEVAALVAFLCRDEAVGITGEALRMSAGAAW